MLQRHGCGRCWSAPTGPVHTFQVGVQGVRHEGDLRCSLLLPLHFHGHPAPRCCLRGWTGHVILAVAIHQAGATPSCWGAHAAISPKSRFLFRLLFSIILVKQEAIPTEMLHLEAPQPQLWLIRHELGTHLGAHGPQRLLPAYQRGTLAHTLTCFFVHLVDTQQCDLSVCVKTPALRRLGALSIAKYLAFLDSHDILQLQLPHIHRLQPPD
mmetsp:Transcript_1405/g.2201  ORF Transcript_1405/g.2201 Transcript_1405/m.2201 type:complete len:211 (+) Transcript_1405:31-663(+)